MTQPDLPQPAAEATPLRSSGDRMPPSTERIVLLVDEAHKKLPAAMLRPGSRPDTRSSLLDPACEWLIHAAALTPAGSKILESP